MLWLWRNPRKRTSPTGGPIINEVSISRIDAFLASTVREVFASYGLQLEEAELDENLIEDPFASSIGFTSVLLPGALVLVASRSVVESSLPANLKTSTIDDEILADWTGELSNQLLGRLKSRFCAAGVDITLSTPTVFAGKDLHHFACQSDLLRRLFFKGGGALLVEFQANFDSDFEIGEGEEESAEGGEAFFF